MHLDQNKPLPYYIYHLFCFGVKGAGDFFGLKRENN